MRFLAGVSLILATICQLCVAAEKPKVIVVGTGLSGLSAALEAAQKGADVTVVEMWSVFGGTSIMSGGKVAIVDTALQRSKNIEDSPELALADFEKRSTDYDQKWVEHYAKNSGAEIYDWLTEAGVIFKKLVKFGGNSVPRAHGTGELGVGLVVPLFRTCAQHPDIKFVWNVKVTDLLAEKAQVVGISGQDMRTGKKRTFRADAVVLATGGFQSNLNLVRENWPKQYAVPDRILTGSGANSMGDGHAMAKVLGAAFHRMDYVWNYPYGLPDPRYPGTDRGVLFAHTRSAWVNASGKLFVEEAGGDRLTAILQQKPACYWAIFDESQKKSVYVAGSFFGEFSVVERLIYGNEKLVKKADTIAALAEASGLPGAALVETIDRHNATKGSTKVEKPPFYAVRLYVLTRKNMGGVQTDHSCRVLDREGKIIPRLYAVGELSGFAAINGTSPLEGTFLGPCVVTGRVAGRTAASESILLQPPVPVEPVAKPPHPKGDTAASCIECHDLTNLTKQNRPGFTHFEYAHRQVLEQKLDCVTCHSTMAPYKPESHRHDWSVLSTSCATCHLPKR